jgi:hypothetical protein
MTVKKLLHVAALMAGASLFTVGLGGCADQDPQSLDQCMRREIFQQCMKALPAGPTATMYNDWDEVVGAGESAAHYQSLRRKSQIKPECGP